MALALFDTNIIIDYLGKIHAAFDEVNHYADAAISAIMWIETMAKVAPSDEHIVRAFLSTFTILHTDDVIMNAAAAVRAASIARKQKSHCLTRLSSAQRMQRTVSSSLGTSATSQDRMCGSPTN